MKNVSKLVIGTVALALSVSSITGCTAKPKTGYENKPAPVIDVSGILDGDYGGFDFSGGENTADKDKHEQEERRAWRAEVEEMKRNSSVSLLTGRPKAGNLGNLKNGADDAVKEESSVDENNTSSLTGHHKGGSLGDFTEGGNQ